MTRNNGRARSPAESAVLPWLVFPEAAQGMTANAAWHADRERVALYLVETVIRDLYGVELRLIGASQRVSEPGQRCVSDALDGIDQVIQTIRRVVFDLGDDA